MFPANIYLPKFNDRNIRKIGEICSKQNIKTTEPLERRHWSRSGVFSINFEHIHTFF